jgi:cytochrome c oxidase assembly protein subunit 15
VVLATIAQAVWLGLRRAAQPLLASAYILVMLSLLQATLGVWTLLLAVPISLGLAHQAGAMLLFAAALYHFWLALPGRVQSRAPQTSASA